MKIIRFLFGWFLRPLDSNERNAKWPPLVIVVVTGLVGAVLGGLLVHRHLAGSIILGLLFGLFLGALLVAGLISLAMKLGKYEAKSLPETTTDD